MTTKRTPPPKPAHKPTKAGAKPTAKTATPVKATKATKPARAPIPKPPKIAPSAENFAREYLIDFNAKQAAIRAGYSPKTAQVQGSRLLSNVKVAAAIKVERDKQATKTGLTAERIIKEALRLATFDVRKLVDNEGNPIPVHLLDDDTAAAIAGLDIQEMKFGETGAVAVVKKYKIADKNSAIERLFKHLGLFEKDNEQKIDPIAAMLAAMGKSALPVKKSTGHDD